MLRHGILGLLNYRKMTGYEIMTVVRDSLGFFWKASMSQIYRELQYLKKKGFISAELIKEEGKTDRSLFEITNAGVEELNSWLQCEDNGSQNLELLMRIFFLYENPAEENIQQLKVLKEHAEKSLERNQMCSQVLEMANPSNDKDKQFFYWKMTMDFGIRKMQMVIDWCDACIEKLESK